jgi:hypothetical protein
MSSLLRDAIVDAKMLREAALKNAETTVIDKYSQEVRDTLEHLLEQEEEAAAPLDLDLGAPDAMATAPPMDMAGPPEMEEGGEAEEVATDIPLAATDDLSGNEGTNLLSLPQTGENVDIEINLDALQEAVSGLQDSEEVDISATMLAELLGLDEASQEGANDLYNVDEDGDEEEEEGEGASSAAALAGSAAAVTATDKSQIKETQTEDDYLDSLVDKITEKLTVDMGATLSGWAGRSSESQKYEMERELAHRRSTDVEEELDTLRKAQEELVFENKQLTESLEQYKQATQELQEGLHDVNLSNARLLYTNRVLRNTSLNERQKTKIADAISKAGSVTEAKTIYQTLESTVGSTPMRGPQSLSEAIGRRGNTVIRASRRESTPSDPIVERMKKLAGIK